MLVNIDLDEKGAEFFLTAVDSIGVWKESFFGGSSIGLASLTKDKAWSLNISICGSLGNHEKQWNVVGVVLKLKTLPIVM